MLILLVLIVIGAILALVFEFFRPLILAILAIYLSVPMYFYISSLDIDPVAKVLLQLMLFIAIYGATFYTLISHFKKYSRRG